MINLQFDKKTWHTQFENELDFFLFKVKWIEAHKFTLRLGDIDKIWIFYFGFRLSGEKYFNNNKIK